MSFCSVYVTCATLDEARKIGRALVESRLAACANILPGIESIYWWEGRVQADNEVALIVKTQAELLDAVIAKVRSLHSYTCPCVVAWPIAAGHPAYLDWVARETIEPRAI